LSAGLPGLGLGGLFFILSALIAPFGELRRTVRGQSSVGAWLRVGRQFALAVVMIVAVDVALRLLYALVSVAGLGEPPSDRPFTVLPLLPIGITAGVLATVLAVAKAMELTARVRSRGLPSLRVPAALPSRPQLLGGATAIAAAWFALLLVGASELSPIAGGATAAREPPGANANGREADAEASQPDGRLVTAQVPTSALQGFAGDSSNLAEPKSESHSSTGPAPSAEGPDHSSTPSPSNGIDAGQGSPSPSESQPEGGGPESGPSAEAVPPAGAGPPADPGPPAHADLPPGAGAPADALPSPHG
jgi:hypothetical protein